jgi:hypothetical protein
MGCLDDEATSLSEFVEWVEAVQNSFLTKRGNLHEPWFRGVSSVAHHLVPGLYRIASEADVEQVEWSIRRGFERRASQYIGDSQGRDAWDFYFLMQHYRVPTRLLDWTDSALVALYFAIYSCSDANDASPAVWALNPFELNRIAVGKAAILESGWSLTRPYLSKDTRKRQRPENALPAAISPRLSDRRMLAQHSQFTVHGSIALGIDQMPELSPLSRSGWLRKIVIKPKAGIAALRLHMATCGIVHTMVFPDLEGLSKDLQRDYT